MKATVVLAPGGDDHADRGCLYATTNQHGEPAVNTAVVYTPKLPAPQGGWPVIAWAHGTVGLGDDCAPSALPRSPRDNEYLSHWLDQGYAIIGTDYVGGVELRDIDVPARSSIVLVDQLRANNQDVILKIYPEEDHSRTVLGSLAVSTPFVHQLFYGS